MDPRKQPSEAPRTPEVSKKELEEKEPRREASKKVEEQPYEEQPYNDEVDEASEESFPASDPPSFNRTTADPSRR